VFSAALVPGTQEYKSNPENEHYENEHYDDLESEAD
jgi:hypothetical protein